MGKRPSKRKQEYTFAEDTKIAAQTVVNIVLTTREDVDPVPFIAALLEGYARRVQTLYVNDIPATPSLPSAIPDADPDRLVRSLRVRLFSEEPFS
jgi:hypothetical protein